MPVHSTWDAPTQPILLHYVGAWTWEELEIERAQLSEQVERLGLDSITLIHDMTSQTQLPLDGLGRARTVFNLSQEKIPAYHIFIISNPTFVVLSQVFRLLLRPDLRDRFQIARNLAQARLLAAERDPPAATS